MILSLIIPPGSIHHKSFKQEKSNQTFRRLRKTYHTRISQPEQLMLGLQVRFQITVWQMQLQTQPTIET